MRKVILESFMNQNLERIKEKLIKGKLIGKEDQISFIPIEPAFQRKDFLKTKRYKVVINGKGKYILRISKDLKGLYEKYKLFMKDFENLIPDIILYYNENGEDILLEEFLEGESIESIIKNNPARENELVEKVIQLYESLNEKVTLSNFENACLELETLLNSVIDLNYITEIDCVLIRTIIQPEIIKLIAKRKVFQKRVSQGDFIDRNIIFSKDNCIRLIDIEFTRETHFYKEDIIRFFNYSSSLSKKMHDQYSIDALDEILFSLNQILLISQIHKEYASFSSLLKNLREESDIFKHSRVIRFLNGDFFHLTQLLATKDKEHGIEIGKRDAEIGKRDAEIYKRDTEITVILNSYTWKIGRIITWPIRKIFSL